MNKLKSIREKVCEDIQGYWKDTVCCEGEQGKYWDLTARLCNELGDSGFQVEKVKLDEVLDLKLSLDLSIKFLWFRFGY